jgi:RNA polymerase sigma-70 factor, ECF subfamily
MSALGIRLPTEWEVAGLIADPDEEFTALVQRQSRFVFRVAYAVLLNAHDAEDAVQETFLRLYRNRGWQHAENERAYLARAAWRVAVDLRRRAAKSPAQTDSVDTATDLPSLELGPEEVLISAGREARIHAMLNTLPEELRVPLVLTSFQELNSREIAAVLDIPEGTVRTRLQRARQMLRQKLTNVNVETPHA